MYHIENTFQTITVQAPSHHNVLGAVKGPELPLLGQVSMMLMLMLMLTLSWFVSFQKIWKACFCCVVDKYINKVFSHQGRN